MKKLLVFAITGVMMLGLTACGGDPLPYDDVNYADYDEEYEDQGEDDYAEDVESYGDDQGVPEDVEYVPDQDYGDVSEYTNINMLLAGEYAGDDGVFSVGFTFDVDGSYYWWADGGATQDGSYYFDGVTVSLTPAGGGQITNLTMDDNGNLTDENGVVYYKQAEGAGSENANESANAETNQEAGSGSVASFPVEEYNSDPDEMAYFVGYWEGHETPPEVWYIFTSEGKFYCNRDKGYLEKGTYLVHPYGFALLNYDDGSQEELFNFDSDFITYTATDGLYRTKTDDTVDQWIIDSFE